MHTLRVLRTPDQQQRSAAIVRVKEIERWGPFANPATAASTSSDWRHWQCCCWLRRQRCAVERHRTRASALAQRQPPEWPWQRRPPGRPQLLLHMKHMSCHHCHLWWSRGAVPTATALCHCLRCCPLAAAQCSSAHGAHVGGRHDRHPLPWHAARVWRQQLRHAWHACRGLTAHDVPH